MDLGIAMFLLSPFVGLLTCVVVHIVVSRASAAMPRVRAVICSILAGMSVVCGIGLIFVWRNAASAPATEPWGAAAVWVLTYLCLVYFYVFGFYNLSESARRIRLLIELYAAGNQGMTIEEILAAYNARMIVEIRVQRLLSGRQIVERGGRYFIGVPLMLYAAKLAAFVRALFLVGESEFGQVSSTATASSVVSPGSRPPLLYRPDVPTTHERSSSGNGEIPPAVAQEPG